MRVPIVGLSLIALLDTLDFAHAVLVPIAAAIPPMADSDEDQRGQMQSRSISQSEALAETSSVEEEVDNHQHDCWYAQ